MPGIYVAALLTTLLCLAFYGFVIRRMRGPVETRWLVWAFVIALPLQPLVFYTVRVPLMAWLKSTLGVTLHDVNVPFPEMSRAALTYVAISTWFAPVTEELAKVVPLLWPALRRAIVRENAARFAMAIGLGFGVGEIWFVAWGVAHNARLGALPFYLFGAFLGERFIVCLNHAANVSFSLRWRWGIVLAMLAHWAGNIPLFFAPHPVLVGAWIQLCFVAGWAWLATLAYGSPSKLGLLVLGRARCPGCGAVYDRSLLGVNAGTRRYEKCGACHKWHWITAKNELSGDSPGQMF